MAYEVITLNLIPSGDIPVIHAAQYDVDRPLKFALKLGEDDFNPSGHTLELQIRKVDNNIVTAAPADVTGNVVTFNSTEQMCACSGTNLGEIQIRKDDLDIATLHFYLVIQRDVLAGGITSESEIHNLTSQIEEIAEEVIGENYYTKTETDDLLSAKADAADLAPVALSGSYDDLTDKPDIPDVSDYYDKEEINTLLDGKADVSDLPDMSNYYDKTATDTLLSAKADTSSLASVATSGSYDDLTNKPTIPDAQVQSDWSQSDNTKVDYIKNKPLVPVIETATIQNVAIASFNDGADNVPLKDLVVDIMAIGGGGTPDTPIEISGFSSGVVTVTDNDQITNSYTFTFGQTVYGGHFDNNGNLVVTHGMVDLGSLNWSYRGPAYPNVFSANLIGYKNATSNNAKCEVFNWGGMIGGVTGATTDKTIYLYYGGGGDFIYIKDTSYTDVPTLISAISGKKFIYELATPITLSITSQKVTTLLGNNNISADCGNLEELTYFKTGCESIASLIDAYM